MADDKPTNPPEQLQPMGEHHQMDAKPPSKPFRPEAQSPKSIRGIIKKSK